MFKIPKEVMKWAWPLVGILMLLSVIANFAMPAYTEILTTWTAIFAWLFVTLSVFNMKRGISPRTAVWNMLLAILLLVVAAGAFGINAFQAIENQEFIGAIVPALKALAGGLGAGLITVSIIGVAKHELE